MRLSIATAAFAILLSSPINNGANAQCPVCTNGLTAAENTPLGSQGNTCGTLIADAKDQDPNGNVCRAMQGAQKTCCPEAEADINEADEEDKPVETPLEPEVVTVDEEAAATGKCFADRAELKYAIDVCFYGGYGDAKCHTDTVVDKDECNRIKQVYGWPMNTWCVSQVADMHFLFVEKEDFNEDISEWDTSSVTDLYETFSYAKSFNQDLSKWDVSKVTKMYGMFNGCEKFNGDITAWDTSSLEDMQWMFFNCHVFNQDISKWDVSKVNNMYESFCYAYEFNSELSEWDTSKVEYMTGLFFDATSFNQDISMWNTENVWSMKEMFHGATAFNQDISSWDLSTMERADRMFIGASSFNQNLCSWKDTFPYDDAEDTFTNSGCTFKESPREGRKSPFCASNDCSTTPNPTGKPTAANPTAVATTTATVAATIEANTLATTAATLAITTKATAEATTGGTTEDETTTGATTADVPIKDSNNEAEGMEDYTNAAISISIGVTIASGLGLNLFL